MVMSVSSVMMFHYVSVIAKRPRPVTDGDDDDIMLPLRQRRLPSYIAIDDTTPAPKPSSNAGLYSNNTHFYSSRAMFLT